MPARLTPTTAANKWILLIVAALLNTNYRPVAAFDSRPNFQLPVASYLSSAD